MKNSFKKVRVEHTAPESIEDADPIEQTPARSVPYLNLPGRIKSYQTEASEFESISSDDQPVSRKISFGPKLVVFQS